MFWRFLFAVLVVFSTGEGTEALSATMYIKNAAGSLLQNTPKIKNVAGALVTPAWYIKTTGGSLVAINPASSSGYDTTDITFWWRAEVVDFSAANGTTDYSAGYDIGQLKNAVITTDAVKTGVYGLDCDGSKHYARFDAANIIDATAGRLGFWYYVTTWDDLSDVFYLYGDSSNFVRIKQYGTADFRVRWTANGTNSYYDTSSGLLTADTWHFLEFAWEPATNYREFFVDGVSAGKSTATIGDFTVAEDYFAVGEILSGGTTNQYFDHIIITSNPEKSLYESRTQLNYNNN